MTEHKKISFLAKNSTYCPVCSASFQKEELLSGGGRMNAGNLTDELHRLYLPTQKFGDVYPLIYPITVCPECYFAAFMTDFETVETEEIDKLQAKTQDRLSEAKKLFPRADFSGNRGLDEGILSYILAMFCYDEMSSKHQPIYKAGLCALRAAWLCNDYHKKVSDENYDYLRDVLYRKAEFFYSEVIYAEKDGREFYEDIPHFGPDIDQNYGFEGVLYLVGLLTYKYGPRGNKEVRIKSLSDAKITISRIVGMGKSSKSKPSDFVEGARDLYADIQEELKKLEEQ